jgi:copper chaperone
MEKSIIKVDGMSCEHCKKAIMDAVSALPGIGAVTVELTTGMVAIDYDPTLSTLDNIKYVIEEQGYEIKGVS